MKQNSISNFLKSFLPTIVLLGLQIVASFAVTYGYILYKVYTYTDGGWDNFLNEIYDTVQTSDFNLTILLFYSILGVIVMGIWMHSSFPYEGKDNVIKRSSTSFGLTLIGVAFLAVGLQYVCVYLLNVLAVVFPDWLVEYQELLSSSGLDGSPTVLLVLYSVIVGPIFEEICYRGLTLRYARRAVPFWVANLTQAILFASMHQNKLQASYTFIFALVLGLIAEKSGSIFIGCIVHIFFNGFSVFLGDYILGGTTPISFAIILYLALVVTYCGYLIIKKRIPYKEEQETADRE